MLAGTLVHVPVTATWAAWERVKFTDVNIGGFLTGLKFSLPVQMQLKEVFGA